MECTVEYDGLHHRWVRRWAKNPIRDEQVLLNLSHGQTVPVVLMTCCLRTARFLSSSATRDSSNDVVGNTSDKGEQKIMQTDSGISRDVGCQMHQSQFSR